MSDPVTAMLVMVPKPVTNDLFTATPDVVYKPIVPGTYATTRSVPDTAIP